MVQELRVSFEATKGERKFVFTMPVGAPLGEAYDACFDVLQEIVNASQKAAEQAKRKEEETSSNEAK